MRLDAKPDLQVASERLRKGPRDVLVGPRLKFRREGSSSSSYDAAAAMEQIEVPCKAADPAKYLQTDASLLAVICIRLAFLEVLEAGTAAVVDLSVISKVGGGRHDFAVSLYQPSFAWHRCSLSESSGTSESRSLPSLDTVSARRVN